MVSKTRTLALLILLVLSMARVSLAQRTTATFAGIAQDSTGAVLPGVEASRRHILCDRPGSLDLGHLLRHQCQSRTENRKVL